MKLIISDAGFRYFELPDHFGRENAYVLTQSLYKHYPNSVIYIDEGSGAYYIDKNLHLIYRSPVVRFMFETKVFDKVLKEIPFEDYAERSDDEKLTT